jgi:hypothetical protein
MTSGLEDLMVVIDWLRATKTAPNFVAEALDKLHKRAKAQMPIDVRLEWKPDDSSNRPKGPM